MHDGEWCLLLLSSSANTSVHILQLTSFINCDLVSEMRLTIFVTMDFLVAFICFLIIDDSISQKSDKCTENLHWDSVSRTCTGPSRVNQTCVAGYKYDTDQKMCLDINECTTGVSTCYLDQFCRNLEGSYKCIDRDYCGQGYEFNRTTQKCDDIDECVRFKDYCDTTRFVCENVHGSFNCREPCPPNKQYYYNSACNTCQEGFLFNPKTKKCEDNDECVEPFQLQCAPYKEICVKKPGLSVCVPHCSGGTSKLNGECIDIDECELHTHNCTKIEMCTNTFGTFHCSQVNCQANQKFNIQTKSCDCQPGYKMNLYTNICEDHDECDDLTPVCGIHGKCTNKEGGYSCLCDEGYEEQNGTCKDIDECTSMKDICGHLQCANTQGNYQCVCPVGYRKNAENICDDINECVESPKVCQSDLTPIHDRNHCFNLVGSYRCINKKCPAEYQKVTETTNMRTCRLINSLCSQSQKEGCIDQLPEKLVFKFIEVRNFARIPYNIGTIELDDLDFDHFYTKVSGQRSRSTGDKEYSDITHAIKLTRSEDNRRISVHIVKPLLDSTEVVVDVHVKSDYNDIAKIYSNIRFQIFFNYAS